MTAPLPRFTTPLLRKPWGRSPGLLRVPQDPLPLSQPIPLYSVAAPLLSGAGNPASAQP